MAQFGVTTALTSIVLSMFMAGLGLGSWGSGRLIRKYESGIRIPALRFYALAELLIGISALLVPHPVAVGTKAAGADGSILLLGTTILGPEHLDRSDAGSLVRLHGRNYSAGDAGDSETVERSGAERSFSYLYLANVLGAVMGAIVSLALIELYGFRGTLKIGAALQWRTVRVGDRCSACGISGARSSAEESEAPATDRRSEKWQLVLRHMDRRSLWCCCF